MKKVFIPLILAVTGLVSNHAFGCSQSSPDLKKSNTIICADESGSKSIDFKLKPSSNFGMYINYVAESSCSDEIKNAMSWITLGTNGEITSSISLSSSSDFFAEAGKNHLLRVDLTNLQACSFYELSFGIDTF